MSKKPKKFEKTRSPKVEIHRNRWLTDEFEVCDGDFWKDIWVSILVSILLPKYWYYIDTYFHQYFLSLEQSVRPVMSLLQLPLTNEPILSSNHLEWRTPCHTSFPHSMHHPTPPPLPCLAPIYSVAFFVTLWFSDLVLYILILKTFPVKIFNNSVKIFPKIQNSTLIQIFQQVTVWRWFCEI